MPKIIIFLRGIVYGLLVSLVVLLFSALALNFTTLTEASIPYLAFVASLLGILIGSSFVGRRIGLKGWLNGGVTGLVFVAILLIFGFIFVPDLSFGLNVFSKLFLGFAFGAVGGMLGINA